MASVQRSTSGKHRSLTRILAKRYGNWQDTGDWSVLRVAQAITSFIAWRFLARAQPLIHVRVLADSSGNETVLVYERVQCTHCPFVACFRTHVTNLLHIMHHASCIILSQVPISIPGTTNSSCAARVQAYLIKMMAVAQRCSQ